MSVVFNLTVSKCEKNVQKLIEAITPRVKILFIYCSLYEECKGTPPFDYFSLIVDVTVQRTGRPKNSTLENTHFIA